MSESETNMAAALASLQGRIDQPGLLILDRIAGHVLHRSIDRAVLGEGKALELNRNDSPVIRAT